ncbi:MAG: hypothetical protein ABIS03_09165 [Gemmatimonadaceae bacterium]
MISSPSAAILRPSFYARIPAVIGAFKLTERTAVRGAPADSLFRYSDSSATLLSVIIYDVAPDVKAVADSQMWAPREGDKFREVQRMQRERGRIGDYVIAFSDTATLTVGRSRIVEHSIASPTRFSNGTIAVEMQYLYLVAGRFVKVRATVPENKWQEIPIRSFARELARIMAGG